jgi:hypothetical protein
VGANPFWPEPAPPPAFDALVATPPKHLFEVAGSKQVTLSVIAVGLVIESMAIPPIAHTLVLP